MKSSNHLMYRFGVLLLVVAGATCLLLQSAQATVLFQEGFNYTPGSNLAPGNDGWVGGSKANLDIASAAMTPPAVDNTLSVTSGYALNVINGTSCIDSNFLSSPVTSGNIYYSFLISSSATPTNNTYISLTDPLGGPANGSGDPLAVYYGSSTGGWKIGVRTTSGGSGGSFETTTLNLNQTYFVVVDYAFNGSGAGYGQVNLWLDPPNSTLGPGGTGQPGTPDATQNAGTPNVVSSIADVAIKAQSVAYGQYEISDLTIGTTWADVTPVVVPEPSTLVLVGLGVLGLVFARRMRR